MKLATHEPYVMEMCICVSSNQRVPELCPFFNILVYPYIPISFDKAWIEGILSTTSYSSKYHSSL